MQNSNTQIYQDLQLSQQDSSFQSSFSFTKPFIIYPTSQVKSFPHSSLAIWTNLQILKYIIFVQKYQKQLTKSAPWSFFSKMSTYVKTRNPNQCRIHYQKTMKKFSNISQMLASHSCLIKKNLQFYEEEKLKFQADYSNKQIQSYQKLQKSQMKMIQIISQDIKAFYETHKKKQIQEVNSTKEQITDSVKQMEKEMPKTGIQYQQNQKSNAICKNWQKVRKSFTLDQF